MHTPTRRFWEEQNPNGAEESWDGLHSQGQTPLSAVRVDEIKGEANPTVMIVEQRKNQI